MIAAIIVAMLLCHLVTFVSLMLVISNRRRLLDQLAAERKASALAERHARDVIDRLTAELERLSVPNRADRYGVRS